MADENGKVEYDETQTMILQMCVQDIMLKMRNFRGDNLTTTQQIIESFFIIKNMGTPIPESVLMVMSTAQKDLCLYINGCLDELEKQLDNVVSPRKYAKLNRKFGDWKLALSVLVDILKDVKSVPDADVTFHKLEDGDDSDDQNKTTPDVGTEISTTDDR